MKKLILCAALLVTTAGLASAGTGGAINLGWLDCPNQGSYALTRTFACNTNTGGGHIMIGTFVAPAAGFPATTGFASVMDLQTAGAAAPWWDLRASLPAGCRPASMTSSFDFTGGPGNCFDYWQGGAVGGHSANQPAGNRVRLLATAALPAGDSRIVPIDPGTEVYTFRLTLNNAKTVGLGACGGCSQEACIVFNSMLVTQVPGTPGGNTTISLPGTAAHVIWQGWTTGVPTEQCPALTPAKSRTWGSIKAIYR